MLAGHNAGEACRFLWVNADICFPGMLVLYPPPALKLVFFFLATSLFQVGDFYSLLTKLMTICRAAMQIGLSEVSRYLVYVLSLWSPLCPLLSTIIATAILQLQLLGLHWMCPYHHRLTFLNLSTVGATHIRPLTPSLHFLSWSSHLNIFISAVESVLISFLAAGQASVPQIKMGWGIVLYTLPFNYIGTFLPQRTGVSSHHLHQQL